MKKEEMVQIIKSYCEKEKDILFSFLFGSSASGKTCLESDIDIGVYLKRQDDKLENKIQNNLEKLLGREVDLVILNRSMATLAWNIIRKGIALYIKDKGLYLDFMLEISREAEDFMDFNLDAWRMKYSRPSILRYKME